MTPQLQQAIRLLQLSTLELQQELQQALESNPLLEQIDTHEEIDTRETQDSETLDTADALEQKEMPEELPLDASWDTIYTAGTPSGTSSLSVLFSMFRLVLNSYLAARFHRPNFASMPMIGVSPHPLWSHFSCRSASVFPP